MMINLSSDSEEDCYMNVAKRLEILKQKYTDDKIENTDLLDASADTSLNTPKRSEKKGDINSSVGITSAIASDDEDNVELDKLLALHSTGRETRSSKRKSNANSSIIESDLNNTRTKRASKRSKPGTRKSNRNVITIDDDTPPLSRKRGRPKGNTRKSVISNDIPIYSVGNTSDYEDISEKQTLFCNKTDSNNVVILNDCDISIDNEELLVKIYWQSSEFFKFNIRKYQNFNTIFNHFSEKENVPQDKLLFTYNDKIIKPDDTPDSIDYNIVKFIDGGIINKAVTKLLNSNHEKEGSGIKLKFQWKKLKKPLEIVLQEHEKLLIAMLKCAEHLEIPLSRLKFEFDGDSIAGTMTPKDLELEGGECIDVKIIS